MRLGRQLACSVGFPIVTSGLLVLAIFFGLGALRSSKDDLSAKTSLRGKVRDISLQIVASRAAAGMRSTTNHVTTTMVPISVTATEQSQAAREAASSASALVAGMDQMDSTARALLEQAVNLEALVAKSIVDDARARPDPQRGSEAAGRSPSYSLGRR